MPLSIAIDGSGNAWVNTGANVGSNLNNVAKLSSTGVELSPANGYTNCTPVPIFGVTMSCVWWNNDPFALDGAGHVWGGLRGQAQFPGSPMPLFISGLSEISNTGTILSGPIGYGSYSGNVSPSLIAIDGSGNVWVYGGGLYEFVGAATPVVTPFSLGVKNGTLGSRP